MFKKTILLAGLLLTGPLVHSDAYAGDDFVIQLSTGQSQNRVVWEGTEKTTNQVQTPHAPPPPQGVQGGVLGNSTWSQWMKWLRSFIPRP